MIVIEGPDGAGKTELATRLSAELEIPVEPKAVNGDAQTITDMGAWVENALSQGFGRRLYDRFSLISELVYAPSMGRPWKPPHHLRSWLVNQLARFYAIQPVIIYCMPQFHTCLKNVKADETNRVVQDWVLMQHIYQLYEARLALDLAISNATVRVWDYEYDADTGYFESLVTTCRQELSMRGFHADARP